MREEFLALKKFLLVAFAGKNYDDVGNTVPCTNFLFIARKEDVHYMLQFIFETFSYRTLLLFNF